MKTRGIRKENMAFLQARLRSSRLPGKVLMPLAGISVIQIILERLKRSRELDRVVVVTSDSPEDDVLAYRVESCGVTCFRGSEKDVLDRFYQAAVKFSAGHIVRLTGDCPLIDPGIIDDVIRFYHQNRADLVSNQLSDTYPDGLDVSVFSFEALELAWRHSSLPSQREHVTPWIIEKGKSRSHGLSPPLDYPCFQNLSRERWTIDEAADYIFFDRLSSLLPVPMAEISWKDVLAVLDRNPHLRKINCHITRNEGYLKSLQEDKNHADQNRPLP